jgi:hypothetical protein
MPDVILPVLDEAAAIPGVLAAMPAGYRPIVVDNGSADGSAEIAADLEIVCFMDCDGSLDAADLPGLVAMLDRNVDLAIGARRASRGAWPLHARLANRVLARELRRRTGLALEDMGPMRAARRLPLLELDLRDRRSGWPLEMVVKAAAADWSIADAPVPYVERQGRSKVTGTVRGTIQAIGDMGAILRAAE